MIRRPRVTLASLLRENELPAEIQVVLTNPLYTRVATLMLGHGSGIFACLVAMGRLGGPWPGFLLAGSLLALAARLHVVIHGRRASNAGRTEEAVRWRRRYQLTAVVWAAVSSALCCFCILGDDQGTRILGFLIAFGTASVISSRNAGLPPFTMILLGVWLLPPMAASITLGGALWPASLITGLFFLALCSIAHHHHRDVMALIDAERQARAAQVMLAARESELRAIFDNVAAGVVEVDLTGPRILRANPLYCRMTGRSAADLLGQGATAITHPNDWKDEARWDGPAEVGQTFSYERRYVHPDGSIVWARVSACVMSVTPDGRPAHVVAIAQDCTEQKKAEAALRASEEMLRLSLDVGRIGSYQRDFTNKEIHCGRETRLMHGFPLGEQPVPFWVWSDMVLPEDHARVECEMAEAFGARREIVGFEYRFMHPGDGIRHIETRARMVYDEAGKPLSSIGVAIDVTERREAEARIAHLAHHDPLTGLPNRALFRTKLDEALARARRGEHFALLCLDLDRFKDVNDTLGHPVGDALLREVTARLTASTRPTDTVARVGGDEFAIIQTRLDRDTDASALAERLVLALQAPFAVDGYHVGIGTSIGIALSPDDGTDPDLLLRRADMALYAAKAEGRGRFRLFERHMDAELLARRTMELDLRQALEQDEFELFYQPVVHVASRRVCGFEALLRWNHPTRGLVAPDRFIPLAEATGLVVPIGAWVLRRACADAATWTNGARVAVNLSAVQFTGSTLVATVVDALECSGLEPHRLELEITETIMLQDTDATLATLHELKALGVTIAMDDFGTGYSSLSYLQRFPFDKVKIDRCFTTHLGSTRESTAIVSAVIDLCGSLEMRTTAEGVETSCQFAALAKIGCNEAQGYYFSRPRPAAEIPDMIAQIEDTALLEPVED